MFGQLASGGVDNESRARENYRLVRQPQAKDYSWKII
jgi:hypothetical protein